MKKMKNFKITYLFAFLIVFAIVGCETDDESEVLTGRDTAGVMITTGGSSSLLGVPSDNDLSIATVDFSTSSLEFVINKLSGTTTGVDHFEVVKQHNDGEEISVVSFNEFPYTVNLTTVDDFLQGTGLATNDLRIGDVFKFKVKVIQTDGNAYSYENEAFNVTVNCFADLTGTYTMTNSVCASSETVTISQNPDGSWYLSTADGGLLQFCSSNNTLQNEGNLSIVCGVVQASNDLTYCAGYGIGCITGGTWDQATGILNLENGNGFFTWADAAYTSTYVRQ